MEAIVKPHKQSIFHKHKWLFMNGIGEAFYHECEKCGARKATYHPESQRHIRFNWLLGNTTTLKQSPTKKEVDK